MPRVEMTAHLYRFFPALKDRPLQVAGQSVAEVISSVEQLVPGFSDYLLDDQGALRRHVFVSVDDTVLVDRRHLSDVVGENSTVFIFQALTGG